MQRKGERIVQLRQHTLALETEDVVSDRVRMKAELLERLPRFWLSLISIMCPGEEWFQLIGGII